MKNRLYTKILCAALPLLWIAFTGVISCGEDDSPKSNDASLQQYIEAKPCKGFLNDAVVTVNGSSLSQELGRDIYSGYLSPGAGFTAGDVITAAGGTVRVSGIPMDSTVPTKYMYDGQRTALNITPLTSLVAEAVQLSGVRPTAENINQVKERLMPLIDPGNLLNRDISNIDEDPEAVAALEGIGHTVYYTLKGATDTLKALGYTVSETHVSRLWGSVADAVGSSQEESLDDVVIGILTDAGFDPQQTVDGVDVLSSIIKTIYQNLMAAQDTLILAQASGDKAALKEASINVAYTAKILAGIAAAIQDKTDGKTVAVIDEFVAGVAGLISDNIDLARQKAVEDPENLKDEIAAVSMLAPLITDKINSCDAGDITDGAALCFDIDESEIDAMVVDLPAVSEGKGIIGWFPADGMVIHTTEPEFWLKFSKPVDKETLEPFLEIVISSLGSGKIARTYWYEDARWVSLYLPGTGTVYHKLTENEYINISWEEHDTLAKMKITSVEFEGSTYSLSYGGSYRFDLSLGKGACFQDGEAIDAWVIADVLFSIVQ